VTNRVEHKKYIKIKPSDYKVWSAWILEYEQYNYPEDLDKVTKLIQSHLELKFCPTQFREMNLGNPMFGHCYHANQALYYFFKDANLKAMSALCDVAGAHWWCEDVDGNIIDITSDQYYSVGTNPPYDKGKETKWYGWKNRPHRKTQDLMKLVQPTSELFFEKYMEKPQNSY
jgi:hypothetical protein